MRGDPVSSEASAQQTLMSMSWSWDGHFCLHITQAKSSTTPAIARTKMVFSKGNFWKPITCSAGEKIKGFPESWWPASLIYSASTKRWYSEECCQKKITALRLRETHHLIFLVDVQEVIYLWKAIWQELLKNKIKVSDLCSCCIVSEWKGERQMQNMALNRPLQNPTQGMRH